MSEEENVGVLIPSHEPVCQCVMRCSFDCITKNVYKIGNKMGKVTLQVLGFSDVE